MEHKPRSFVSGAATRSIFGPPQDAAGITTSEHGTVWRPIDVVSSVATRARNFLFSNLPLCLHFRAEAALLVHSTLATGQEWRMGPWRDKDALDALDGTIPRRSPLLADGHSARSGKSTRHVPVSYEYGHMFLFIERFACWFWRAKANNLGARLIMNPATRTSAYLKRRRLRSRPVLDVSARYPTRAGAEWSGTRTCTDVNIGLRLNWIDVTSPAKSVRYRYRLESDMPTIKTDDRGFKAVDGPKTLASTTALAATASTAARDAPGIAAAAPQPAASRASRASSTFGLAGRTIAGFNALRRPGSSSLHAWQRGQEKQKKRKEGKKGTRKSSTPACACICVLMGTGDWPSKPLRSSSLPASESQRGSSAFFASTISSPPAAASASYKYPNACPASFVDCWLTAFRCLFLSCPVLSCLLCAALSLSFFYTLLSRLSSLLLSSALLLSSPPPPLTLSLLSRLFRLLRSNPPLLSLIGHLTGALFCDAADTPAGWHQGGYRPKWTGQHQKNGRE
ncbi:hypothetical protein Trihar35433_3836 [Trichoderma harzianum]|nr:hypothetical protein Trihar35433_3836 [Trichoderma harzianum]